MPLKRTPPPAVSPQSLAAPISPRPKSATPVIASRPISQQMSHYSSEPNLVTDKEDTIPCVVVRNVKRKYAECTDTQKNTDIMVEMRELFRIFTDNQNQKVDKICKAVEDMKLTLEFMSQKFEELKLQQDKLQLDRKEDLKYIKTLEDKIENLERSSRATCLEIRNIPSSPAERKSSLLNTVTKIGQCINAPVEAHQVKDVFRIKSKDPSNRTIIVDFMSVLQKQKVITMFREFNNQQSKLTTEHLKISGPPRPIYISENLTAKMKRIFYLSRDFAKSNDYKFCWVTNGHVYLRKRENGPLVNIRQESDLANISANHK